MKYDRPVWQIMHECADAMPDVFRYEDVRNWFDSHYPDVNEATIRAHLIGLTEGGRAKHVQFAQRSPVFRRVARGEYEPIPLAERGEDPNVALPSASQIKMSGNGIHKPKSASPPPTPVDDIDQVVPVVVEAESSRPEPRQTEPVSTDPAETEPAATKAVPTETGPIEAEPAEAESIETVPVAPVLASVPHLEPEPSPAETPDEVDTDDEQVPPALVPDVILLGSVGDRVNVPAPAKEVFREVSFQLSRLDAELSGSEWFVLSAEHGLVAPNEWMSPDSRTLADMDLDYRITWATWVVARLESMVGSLDGMVVRVDAPDAFIGPLFADLQEAGAIVTSGTAGVTVPPLASRYLEANSIAHQLAEPPQTERVHDDEPAPHDEPEQHISAEHDADHEPDSEFRQDMADVVRLDPALTAGNHLADPQHAVSATDTSLLPDTPGLYGWFVDPVGARELNRCLMLPVRAGLLFIGQVGGSSWQSLADPVLNLRDHIERVQLHGRARASTFRMTLATVLAEYLRMTSLEDPKLTEWMLEHLSITYWPSADLNGLRELEQVIITELDPPLNVDHLPASEYRARLSQMRGAVS